MSVGRLAVRRQLGGIEPPKLQNPTAVAYGMPAPRTPTVRHIQSGSGAIVRIQSGSGSLSDLKTYLDKGAAVGRAATGPVGTAIRNALPSSDNTARPGFPGEMHAILRLPNGRPGVANWMGPGTNVEARLQRGDPPRTESDRVARTHDIRYALANNNADVRVADQKMVQALKRVAASKGDSRVNIEMGLRPIQAKMLLERSGVAKPEQFASTGGIPSGRRGAYEALEASEGAAGYGLALPGGQLKEMLLAQSAPPKFRPRSAGSGLSLPVGSHGAGLSLPGGMARPIPYGAIAKLVGKAVPFLLKTLGESTGIPFHKVFSRGKGLKLAGQGVFAEALAPLAMSGKSIQLGSGVLDSLRSGFHSAKKGFAAAQPHLRSFANAVKPFASQAAKALLPLLVSAAKAKMGMGGGSAGPPKKEAVKALAPGFIASITRLLARVLGGRGMPKGQAGMGFWSDFAKGFMMVMNPALKVAKTVAPIIPMLL